MRTKPLFSFLALLVIFFAQVGLAQPVAPNTQLQPKTTDVKTIPKVIPDLPYKPQELLVPSDVKGDDESTNSEGKALDWTKIPPLSPKGPNFQAADDPLYD